MSQILNGSICVTDLVNFANAGHSSCKISEKNGKIYANLSIFINEEPDQYNNNASIALNSTKEGKATDAEKKTSYIGNAKWGKGGGSGAIAAGSAGLSLNGGNAPAAGSGSTPSASMEDLPF